MSDEELIEQLRSEPTWGGLVALTKQAADRIKALTEQLAAAQQDADEAEAYAEELEKERDEARAAWEIEAATVRRFAERHTRHLVMGAEARDGAERAEAKLAKVVAAAGKMLDAFCVHEDSHQSAAYEAMCAALAETERESHE